MQLFYHENSHYNDLKFSFDAEESKHIIKVLRKKEGDTLWVTNGKGYLFETKICQAFEKKCQVEIIKYTFTNASENYFHIAVAPTKMNERFEWFLEKATEIGIHEITPIICDHSERKIIKTDRFEKIILSAIKQSNQVYLPKFNQAISLSEFIKNNHCQNKFIAHCQENEKIEFKNLILNKGEYTILIGPEGDFSFKEIELALTEKYLPVSLGQNRLRTETAALVACHTLQLKLC